MCGTQRYEIEVTNSTSTWVFYKRYSEIHTLHGKLKGAKLPLPALPGKKTLGKKKTAFVEKRRVGLEGYLQGLLRVVGIQSNTDFRAFIELDDKSPETDVRPNAKASWVALFKSMMSAADEAAALITRLRQTLADGGATERIESNLAVRLNRLGEGLSELDVSLSSDTLNITGKEKLRRGDLLRGLAHRRDELVLDRDRALGKGSSMRAPPPSSSAAAALMGGAAASGGGRERPRSSRWGVQGESEDTVDLNNRELLSLQEKIMENQDEGLDALSQVMDRQLRIGTAIGQELDHHNQLLQNLDDHVAVTQAAIDTENKKVIKLHRRI